MADYRIELGFMELIQPCQRFNRNNQEGRVMRMPARNICLKAAVMWVATGLFIQAVQAQFTQEEFTLSEEFVERFIGQVDGYIIMADHNERYLQWLIGLNELHDIQRARWQIQNMMVTTEGLQMVKPWEFSDTMEVYITQLLLNRKILFTLSFSPHHNGFVVLSHGQVDDVKE